MTTIKEQLLAAIEATPEPILEQTLDYLEYLKAKKNTSANSPEALMQAGEPILRGSKAKDLLKFAGTWQGDDFEEFILWQQQHQKPSLANAFAELREICAEENYHLEVPRRHDRSNPFVESPHDLSL